MVAEADEGDEAAADELLYDELGVLLLAPTPSRGESFVERFPYLFLRYRAQLLSASLSPSDPRSRSGEGSRDFMACVERLRDSSDPDESDDVPYLEESDKGW